MKLEIQATARGGTLPLGLDRPTVKEWLLAREGREVKITLSDGRGRSNPQNRRYWGVIVPGVREFLSRGRPVPLSNDEVHIVLAVSFLGVKANVNGVAIPKETRTLSVEEFSTYCEKIVAHFSAEGARFADDPEEESWIN